MAAGLSLVSSAVLLLVVRALLPPHVSFVGTLMSWDAGWYVRIAVHGYSWNPRNHLQQDPNFFPLYPLFERLGHRLTGLSIAGFAIGSSIVFQAVAAALLALIVRAEGGTDRESLFWVIMFLVSPPVIFDVMGYYSALFCVLTYLAILFALRRKKWVVAVAVGLASGMNPIGLAFAGAFVVWAVIEMWSEKRHSVTWRSLVTLAGQAAVSVAGIGSYALYLWVRFGNPIAFYDAAKAWTAPLPLSKVISRIVILEPLRKSFTDWATLPYGANQIFLMDAFTAIAVLTLIVALIATKGSARTFGFWLITGAFVLVQWQSARWASEIATTRYLLPAAFAVGAIGPVRRALSKPLVFALVVLVLLAGTTVDVRHLATGQWI